MHKQHSKLAGFLSNNNGWLRNIGESPIHKILPKYLGLIVLSALARKAPVSGWWLAQKLPIGHIA